MSRPLKTRRVSLYLPHDLADEVEAEAKRQERHSTWLLTRAWLLARDQIRATPAPIRDSAPIRRTARRDE